VDTTRFTDLFDAFGTEVDRGSLAVFLRAHFKPGVGVCVDLVGESSQSISCWGTRIARTPILEDTSTMPNHPRHRSTTGQEVTIAKGIASNYTVGSNQRVVANPFDETEQCRSIDHLDLHQLLPRKFKDLCCLLDVVVIIQLF